MLIRPALKTQRPINHKSLGILYFSKSLRVSRSFTTLTTLFIFDTSLILLQVQSPLFFIFYNQFPSHLHRTPYPSKIRHHQSCIYFGLQAQPGSRLHHVCGARTRRVQGQDQGQLEVCPAIIPLLAKLDTDAVTVMPPELRRKR